MSGKMRTAFVVFAALILFVFGFLAISQAKSLNNADIRHMEGQQNKGVPTYKGNAATSKPNQNQGVPSEGVPPIPGNSPGAAPMIPGPPGIVENTGEKGAVVIKKHLPYQDWADEYNEYFKSHYHDDKPGLKPKLIVIHYSKTPDFAKLWWTFVNGGNYEGKPGHLSVHYVVDKDGTVYELIPPDRKARGTYGVNHVAISIDLVGAGEMEVLHNKKQMDVSFALVKWLMNKFKIRKDKVLAHYEVAKGKAMVPEYTDYYDTKYPDSYPPGSQGRGPGKAYMAKLRYYLSEK